MKYEVIIYWSDEDQAFIAEVPELPGCAADGETYQEAVQNVEIIMQQWIETAQEIGRSVPQPKGRLRIKDMSLVRLLNPQQHEHILDLGCGDGKITKEIADSGARVVGIDIFDYREDSCKNFQFEIRKATDLDYNQEFDAVFSNRVIHLIKPPEQVISSVWNALKPGGRFVAEFYGHGTAEEIILALQQVMSSPNNSFNVNEDFPWYLPTQEQYCKLLTSQGFTVIVNRIFPEKLEDVGDIRTWTGNLLVKIERFGDMDDKNRQKIYLEVEKQVRSQLYENNKWFVNCQHIRIVAIKSSQLSNNN